MSPLTLIFKNSVFSDRCKSIGGFDEVSLNVLIKFSFHASLFNCQAPKQIVRIMQNNEKIKNL